MKLRDIRSKFLNFFTTKGHVAIRSSSLIPLGDPSVLLTTAGMQQFKPYFLGERDVEKDLKSRKLTSVQKCFRTSDITEVGDQTHLTFFEMLGNFSVGDYFKKEVIDFAWDFCTKVVHLNPDRLWATYYHAEVTRGKKNPGIPSDAESVKLWQAHLPKDRIAGFGHDANF